MRFCPFCSAENAAEAVSCAACGRRLPPPPNRRARTAAGPPTGVLPRLAPLSRPPTVAAPSPAAIPPVDTTPSPAAIPPVDTTPSPAAAPPVDTTPTAAPVPPVDTTPTAAPAPPVDTAPSTAPPAPPPPVVDADADARRALTNALLPPPSALRRTAPLPEPRPPGVDARRASDRPAAPPPPPSDATQPVDDAWLMDPSELAAPAPPAPPIEPTPPPSASAPSIESAPTAAPRDPTATREPPPTRLLRTDGVDDRPFIPPTVMPVPEVPDHGLVNAARYAVAFARARWQRRRAVKLLRAEINSDTAALDGVLLTLGREARAAGIDNRVLADENAAITEAEKRRDAIAEQGAEVLGRKGDENSKFEEIERQRQATVGDAERVVADAQRDVTTYEAQRRSLRDKRKDLERRQKAYLQAAEAREGEAGRSPMGDARAELRRAAEGHRREAASLDPDRQDLERKLAAIERPLSTAQAKLEAAKAELDGAKRALADAREGHRHRLAELDAEHGKKLRDHELAEAEIVRRLVTLGTLINLHRVPRPDFDELYQRIDRLRSAINARTTEIDRLTAERTAYDRPSLTRGWAVIAGVGVAIIAVIAIILAAT